MPVSCYKHCPNGDAYCEESAKLSVCGQCQNTGEKMLCIVNADNPYGLDFHYDVQLARCENGVIVAPLGAGTYKECALGTCDAESGRCAATGD